MIFRKKLYRRLQNRMVVLIVLNHVTIKTLESEDEKLLSYKLSSFLY